VGYEPVKFDKHITKRLRRGFFAVIVADHDVTRFQTDTLQEAQRLLANFDPDFAGTDTEEAE
jgi:hypothetical protein